MSSLEKILSGGDLRSIGQSNLIVANIKNQNEFAALFKLLFHPDRLVVMRAVDAIEKITIESPQYLTKYKKEVLRLLKEAVHIELKWHLGLLISRLSLNKKEFDIAWDTLIRWAKDKTNSRLVRVGAVQGLFEMSKKKDQGLKDFNLLAKTLERENIPSINARIRNIRKEIAKLK